MTSRTLLLVSLVVVAAVAPGLAGATPAADERAVDGSDVGIEPSVQAECSFPFSQTDATGTEVTVESDPETVVTLGPSAAQTMWEIDARSEVVGLTQFAAYLGGAGEKANVSGSGPSSLSIEKVVGLQPDLVLAPNIIGEEAVSKLRESGLTVYKFRAADSLDFVVEKTRLTGQLTGNCEGATRRADRMASQLRTVREAVEGEDRPRVLYYSFAYTAGSGTFIHDVIETAGGTNVAAEANITFYAQVNQEIVVEYDPEWMVLTSGSTVPNTEAYNSTTAVREDQILTVQSNLISQPAPRVMDVVLKLVQAFHPEAYEEAKATATSTSTPTPDGTVVATSEPTPTPEPVTEPTVNTPEETPPPATTDDTGVSTPGFGVAAAVLALAGATLLARRRP